MALFSLAPVISGARSGWHFRLQFGSTTLTKCSQIKFFDE